MSSERTCIPDVPVSNLEKPPLEEREEKEGKTNQTKMDNEKQNEELERDEEEEDEQEEIDDFDMTEAPPEEEVSPFQEKIGSLINHMSDQPRVLSLKQVSSSSYVTVLQNTLSSNTDVSGNLEPPRNNVSTMVPDPDTQTAVSTDDVPLKLKGHEHREDRQEEQKKIEVSSLLVPGSTFVPPPNNVASSTKKRQPPLADDRSPSVGEEPVHTIDINRTQPRKKLKENDWATSVTKKFKEVKNKKKSQLQSHSFAKRTLSPVSENVILCSSGDATPAKSVSSTSPAKTKPPSLSVSSLVVLPPEVTEISSVPPKKKKKKKEKTKSKSSDPMSSAVKPVPANENILPSEAAFDLETTENRNGPRKTTSCRSVFSKTAVFFLGVFSALAGSEIIYRLLPCEL